MNVAIIAAGGKGERFRNSLPKQLFPLKGKPMLSYTLLPFHLEQKIDDVILVYPFGEPEEIYRRILEQEKFQKVRLVSGGESRYTSVRNGFEAIRNAQPRDVVLIHDAARPLLSSLLLTRLLEVAAVKGAAVPVMTVGETVKKVENQYVTETVPREHLFLAQTPQGFWYEVLKRAYDLVPSHSFTGYGLTDEAMLVEQSGFPVAVVPGEKQNIKITEPEDVSIAECYLQKGGL